MLSRYSFVVPFRKKANSFDPMVFACVSMTAKAVGPKMAGKDKIFKEIIDQMLGVGLRYVVVFYHLKIK